MVSRILDPSTISILLKNETRFGFAPKYPTWTFCIDKLKVFKMNIDENPMTPQKFGVRGIPTIMLFKEGQLIDTKVGSLPKSALETWIKSNL